MSWGTELWDQFDEISSHTQKGLEFCERYSHFIKERCAIEREYAAKLSGLVKKYQPKKKEEEEYEYTCAKGFLSSIKEVIDIAGQHEMIAENLSSSIIKEAIVLIHELKQERKKYLQEGREQAETLKIQLEKLDRSKRQYEKAFKDSEKAQESYRKADADINLSRAEVEKAKNISINKQQHCESCKNEYAAELQKTNHAQQEHYGTLWPRIFQNLQDMDEKRVSRIQEFIRQTANIERNVIPIINACIDGMVKAADSIDSAQDSRSVIDKYKSGFQPPGDIPFEDLSNMGFENHNHSNTPKNTLTSRDLKGTVSGGKIKKRSGLAGLFRGAKTTGGEKSLRGAFNGLVSRTDDTREDYSHLPPNQQKKKLNQKIDGLRTVIAKETAERDGMLKMRDVYVQNPALGDPSSLDKQLEENAQKLDKLRQEQQKFEGYLAEADKRNNCQKNAYGSDESLTRSTSDASVSQPQQPQPQPHRGSLPVTPSQNAVPQTNPPRESPDSGVDGTQRGGSFAEQDSFDDGLDDDLVVIGTCRAMYPFEAQNDGSVPMTEGEELQILEQDQGDGWTRVRKKTGDEGFVPTSYIDVHFYDQ